MYMYEGANFAFTVLTISHGTIELWRFIEKTVTFGDSIKRRGRKSQNTFALRLHPQLR